ncbi:MAG: hypothetical protein K8S22_14955, partial [Betaproteobacteria bacterium]|nr:hypothetical protein [Betaproteobacteria bacterium]
TSGIFLLFAVGDTLHHIASSHERKQLEAPDWYLKWSISFVVSWNMKCKKTFRGCALWPNGYQGPGTNCFSPAFLSFDSRQASEYR